MTRTWGRRRRFVAAACVLASLAACGAGTPSSPPEQVPTVAVLRAVQSTGPDNLRTFVAELRRGGFVSGKRLRVLGADPAEVHADPAEAEAVVRRWARDRLDLVVALSSSGSMAAAKAAPGVNVLFLSNDPSAVGLLSDERRPEGRLTGATFRVPADRTLDLARRALPGLTRIGLLYPTSDPAASPVRDATARAAQSLGLTIVPGPFDSADAIASVIEDLRSQGVGCLLLANAPTTVRNYPAITAALATGPIPVVANTAADFALIVLEPDTQELYRQMGRQAVRLLSGTPVSQVPVEDPARFRFVLNRRVAAQLGLEIPPDVVRSADTVVGP